MILHGILLQGVERLKQAMGVTPNAFKREELAESRGGWVYNAGTVGACRAPRQKRGFSSRARRAGLLPDRVLELPHHARGTLSVVAIVSGLCEGRGFEGVTQGQE